MKRFVSRFYSTEGKSYLDIPLQLLKSLEKQKIELKQKRDMVYTQNMKPPRLGTYAGRSVACSEIDLPRAFNQLQTMNRVNSVMHTKHLQRYHEQPNKQRWRIYMTRKRRDFKQKMRVLFHLAVQAQKRNL